MSKGDPREPLNVTTALLDKNLAEGRGDKPAILCGDETVTYAGLHESVCRMGNALLELGVRMEERVAMLLPDSPEFAYAFFGAMRIGAVAVPMNTTFQPHEYEYMLNDSRARVLVVSASLVDRIEPIRPRLKYVRHVVVAGDDSRGDVNLSCLLQRVSAALPPVETWRDDAAFWLYSSGTTGRPKGTVHLHHDMLVIADAYARQTIGLRESDISFSVAKLFFAYGLGNGLYFPLHTGGTTVLLPDRPTPERVWEVIDRYRPTVFYGVPSGYAMALHAAETNGRQSMGAVRMCLSAGEPLTRPIYERWKARFGLEILDGIGSTEILHIFISNRPGQSIPGSTGRLVPGFEARLVDDRGRDVPPGEEGTLLIKGDSVAAGYWNQHEQSKQTFLGDWVNTRDRFRIDEEGYFWYGGRTDDMIKVNGQVVWPSELESIILGHPAVLECAVVGATDDDGLTKPRAYVVLKPGCEPTAELVRELQEHVKQSTAPYKYPRWVEFVESLPKTSTGKIQRYRLRNGDAQKVQAKRLGLTHTLRSEGRPRASEGGSDEKAN